MAMYTDPTALFPTQYGELIDNAVKNQAVAAQVLSPVGCTRNTMSFPVLESDPSTAWYAEGAEITQTDAGTSELVITPLKVAGLTRMSNEAVADSSPDVANMIGQGLSRQIVEKIDSALFAATPPANGATGLMGYGYSVVGVDGGVGTATNEDPFTDAKFLALDNGATLSHFVLASDVAQALSKVKIGSGDARTLLSADLEGNLRIAGLPALVSRHVASGEAWGVDRSQNFMVIRQGTEVVADRSAAFSSDSTLVRAIQRTNFAVTNAPGVVRLYDNVA